MTPIRPLQRDDLPAVARLYELVIRSGTEQPPAGLAGYFERTVLDQPFADPELPSLVYEDPQLGVVGFIASYPRRFTLGDRPVRLACSGQLVAHPDVRSRGVGALLMRAYMNGPQDLSLTDGATDEVRAIWERLGGVTNAIASLGWTRVLGPSGYAAGILQKRRSRDDNPAARAPGGRLWSAVDELAGRPLRPPAPDVRSQPLTADALLELMERLRRTFSLRPAYDTASLTWLFQQMEQVSARGELVRQLVRAADDRPLGWYVAYVPEGGVAQALQVVAARADVGAVLDALLHDAGGRGAVAVSGRVDPWLYPDLVERRCVFRRTAWALLYGRDDELLASIALGRGLLTRMDGEWWMGPHVLDGAALERAATD